MHEATPHLTRGHYSGHQGAYAMREIINAIVYQGRTGCQWAYLPHDLPPKSATYYYFAAWRDDGTDQVIHEAVDVLGLVIAVVVLAVSAHDAGIALLDQVAEHAGGTAEKALVDQGFKNQVTAHGASLGIDVETVARNPQEAGFVPQPKRWRVEQTYGILITAPASGPRRRAPPGLLRLPRLLGHDPGDGPPRHRREHPHLAPPADGDRVNLQPLLDALGIQEDAAQALVDDLRTWIDELHARLREPGPT